MPKITHAVSAQVELEARPGRFPHLVPSTSPREASACLFHLRGTVVIQSNSALGGQGTAIFYYKCLPLFNFLHILLGQKLIIIFKSPTCHLPSPPGKAHELTFMCFIGQIAIFISALTSGNKPILMFSMNSLTHTWRGVVVHDMKDF